MLLNKVSVLRRELPPHKIWAKSDNKYQSYAFWTLMAFTAFVWPFFDKGCKIKFRSWDVSYLHAKFEQNRTINSRLHLLDFKGHCSLCLAFLDRGLAIKLKPWALSYLHTKFEQNRFRNAGDMSCWSSYQLGGADQGLGSENKIIAHPSGEWK